MDQFSVVLALLLALYSQLFVPCLAAPGPVVDTIYGKVQGKLTDKAQVFTSVPYATPPVGKLRWKDSQPPKPWPGVISVIDDPPGCPQSVPCDLPLPDLICPKRVAEDCLYLNVFTPLSAKPTSRFPVMVFIHGGNFLRGYSGGLLYDGQYIANTSSTVVVTINYRLGAIGFLVFGSQSSDSAIKGNYGFKDQQLALEWVRDNIAAFGGNPFDVTIWGQSAGAISVAIHMTSVRSSGLFHKAILESEPFGLALKGVDDAKKLGEDFAKALGCGTDDTDCLYSKDIPEIASAQNAVLSKIINLFHVLEVFLQWTPIVDGFEILDQPLTLFVKGEVAAVPMMIGTTSEETVFFIYDAFTKPVSALEYDALLLAVFTIHFEEVHKRYPTPSGDARSEAAVLATDWTFTCATRHSVRGFIDNVAAPVWLYVFNHSLSFDGWGKNFSYCDGHSCHGSELPFVFHTATLGGFNYTEDELVLANTMVQYWTNFAHTGDPNNGGSENKLQSLMQWPQYDGTVQCMRFKTPGDEIISKYREDNCDFLDTVGYSV